MHIRFQHFLIILEIVYLNTILFFFNYLRNHAFEHNFVFLIEIVLSR